MIRERILDAATGLLVIAAVIVTGLVVRRELFADPSPRPARTAVSDWRQYAQGGHRTGPADAALTVVTFSDFQCPACGAFERTLADLQQRHPDRVAVVYRHLPLAKHPHAVAAARASECAAAQGSFEPYRHAVYARQDSIGTVPWRAFAEKADVRDLAAFDRCVASSAPVPALGRDSAAAARLRATGTPTILVNQFRYEGALTLDEMEAHLRRAGS
jgi:protein-disulfide isomerase